MFLGHHLEKKYIKSKNIYDNILAAIELIKQQTNTDIKVLSFFIMGPKSSTLTITDEDIVNIPKLRLHLYIHNCYIAYPWGLKYKQGLHFIYKQLNICDVINAKGFILHLPNVNKKETVDDIIDIVIQQIPNLIKYNNKTKIFLEIPAILPSKSVFHDPNNINKLFNSIHKISQNFGLCIDTAHLWSSGLDISSYENFIQWLNMLQLHSNNIIIHLNDNEKLIGKCPDIHCGLFTGQIWKQYKNNIKKSGLYALIHFANKNKISIIFERKDIDSLINDYLIVQKI